MPLLPLRFYCSRGRGAPVVNLLFIPCAEPLLASFTRSAPYGLRIAFPWGWLCPELTSGPDEAHQLCNAENRTAALEALAPLLVSVPAVKAG